MLPVLVKVSVPAASAGELVLVSMVFSALDSGEAQLVMSNIDNIAWQSRTAAINFVLWILVFMVDKFAEGLLHSRF